MILELDMGNTRIKWRLRNESGNVARGYLSSKSAWQALASGITATVKAELPALHFPLRLQQLRVASVLDEERNQSFREWCFEAYGIQADFAVSQPAAAGVINGYKHPEQLGVDRWLAILAGFAQVKHAVVVVDLGSALTVDLVTTRGEHLGGYIGPGLAAMRNTLLGNTQKVTLTDVPAAMRAAPGRSTDAAVAAALSTMVIGLIKEAVKELAAHGEDPALVLTGGDAELLQPFFPSALIIFELVLDGLALANVNR
jgi:type III pantothenate kinase